jgi:hypothetical protein
MTAEKATRLATEEIHRYGVLVNDHQGSNPIPDMGVSVVIVLGRPVSAPEQSIASQKSGISEITVADNGSEAARVGAYVASAH